MRRRDPDKGATAGRSKGRGRGIERLPAEEKKGIRLEIYEQPVERPGPDSAKADRPDGISPPPDPADA